MKTLSSLPAESTESDPLSEILALHSEMGIRLRKLLDQEQDRPVSLERAKAMFAAMRRALE